MRFLVDESTGASVAAWLRAEGHDVVTVADTMPAGDDEEVLARAVSGNRILVTNDKDFGELVYRSGSEHRGVVLLRLRDERPDHKVRMMAIVLTRLGDRLRNRYVVVTETGIRVRGMEGGARSEGSGLR